MKLKEIDSNAQQNVKHTKLYSDVDQCDKEISFRSSQINLLVTVAFRVKQRCYFT